MKNHVVWEWTEWLGEGFSFTLKKIIKEGKKMLMLCRKFRGNPRNTTLLQHLNSIEDGNLSSACYSDM